MPPKRTTSQKGGPKAKKQKVSQDEPTSEVAKLWKQIEEALDPENRALLLKCKGATKAALTKAEKELGFSLPLDLRESLSIHDITEEIGPLRVMGLGNSLKDAVQASLTYSGGPMATRFEGNDSEEEGFLSGLFHIFTYEEDRTYFFLVVDCHGPPDHAPAVAYLDFGDLVCEPKGNLLCFSFVEYLRTVLRSLQSDEPPLSWFPPPDFGFAGTDRILSLFDDPRNLNIEVAGDNPFDQDVDVRGAFDEAYADLTMLPVMEKWKKPEKVSLDNLPAPPSGCEKLTLKWDTEKMPKWEFDGLLARTSNYSASTACTTGFNFGKNWEGESKYFEFILGPGTIYNVGLSTVFDNPTYPKPKFCFGLSRKNSVGGCYDQRMSSQRSFGDDYEELTEGHIVGVKVEKDQVSWYLNRKPVISLKVEIIKGDKFQVHYGKNQVDIPDETFYPYINGHQFEAEIVPL